MIPIAPTAHVLVMHEPVSCGNRRIVNTQIGTS